MILYIARWKYDRTTTKQKIKKNPQIKSIENMRSYSFIQLLVIENCIIASIAISTSDIDRKHCNHMKQQITIIVIAPSKYHQSKCHFFVVSGWVSKYVIITQSINHVDWVES